MLLGFVMNRKSIAFSGVFLILTGLLCLVLGLWCFWTSGFSTDFSVGGGDVLMPELSGNILWFISVSCTTIVLGIVFVVWTYMLRSS